MTKYDGPERRTASAEGREGRRPGDRHCSQHVILWEHHEKDKDEFRKLSCGKIFEIKTNLALEVDKLEKVDAAISARIDELNRSIVGKYWFRIVVSFLCAGLVGLGIQQNWAFREILENQKEFSVTINTVENQQIRLTDKIVIFEKEIEAINKRQDVLRDAHLKIVQEKK
jgi:hypothetical protein